MNALNVVWRSCLIIFLAAVSLYALGSSAGAQGLQKCEVAGAERTWTAQENWAWKRLCGGLRADLGLFGGNRNIRSAFIVEMLTDRDLHDVLPATGIVIAHATFTGPLQLAHHQIDQPLALEFSHFDSTLDLSRLATSTNLSLSGSSGGFVDLRYLHAGDLWLRATRFSEINASNASIGGWLFADHTRVRGRLDLTNATISNALDFDNSQIANLRLPGAQIGSILSVKDAVISKSLDMSEATVGRQAVFDDSTLPEESTFVDLRVGAHLRLPKDAGDIDLSGSQVDGDLLVLGSHIKELQLARAHIGGQISVASASLTEFKASGLTLVKDLSVVNSTISKILFLENDQVGGSVVFDKDSLPVASAASHLAVNGNFILFHDTVSGDMHLDNLMVAGDLQVSGDKLHALDVTGSKISGDLLLGQVALNSWQGDSEFIMRNASVRAIEDRNGACTEVSSLCDAWPKRLDLTGMTYERLGTSTSAPVQTAHGEAILDPAEQTESWWHDHWLERQKPYSPEPYDELASVLRRLGNDEVADKVMYDRHDEEMRANWYRKPVLIAQGLVIGYGYDVWRAYWCALAFVLAGVLILKFTGQGKKLGLRYGITYSFDMLLPLIRLREANYKLEPTGFVQYYFYVHKIAGYVLGAFLLAALTGLTKQ